MYVQSLHDVGALANLKMHDFLCDMGQEAALGCGQYRQLSAFNGGWLQIRLCFEPSPQYNNIGMAKHPNICGMARSSGTCSGGGKEI